MVDPAVLGAGVAGLVKLSAYGLPWVREGRGPVASLLSHPFLQLGATTALLLLLLAGPWVRSGDPRTAVAMVLAYLVLAALEARGVGSDDEAARGRVVVPVTPGRRESPRPRARHPQVTVDFEPGWDPHRVN